MVYIGADQESSSSKYHVLRGAALPQNLGPFHQIDDKGRILTPAGAHYYVTTPIRHSISSL